MDAIDKKNKQQIIIFNNRVNLTVKCWNNHARIILVATLGKIPRFFWRFFELSSRSSSGPEPTLSKLSPEIKQKKKGEFLISRKSIHFYGQLWLIDKTHPDVVMRLDSRFEKKHSNMISI